MESPKWLYKVWSLLLVHQESGQSEIGAQRKSENKEKEKSQMVNVRSLE